MIADLATAKSLSHVIPPWFLTGMTALGVTTSLKIHCCREPVPRRPAARRKPMLHPGPSFSQPTITCSERASSASTSGRRGAPVLPLSRVHLSPAEAMQTVHVDRTAGFQRPTLASPEPSDTLPELIEAP